MLLKEPKGQKKPPPRLRQEQETRPRLRPALTQLPVPPLLEPHQGQRLKPTRRQVLTRLHLQLPTQPRLPGARRRRLKVLRQQHLPEVPKALLHPRMALPPRLAARLELPLQGMAKYLKAPAAWSFHSRLSFLKTHKKWRVSWQQIFLLEFLHMGVGQRQSVYDDWSGHEICNGFGLEAHCSV